MSYCTMSYLWDGKSDPKIDGITGSHEQPTKRFEIYHIFFHMKDLNHERLVQQPHRKMISESFS